MVPVRLAPWENTPLVQQQLSCAIDQVSYTTDYVLSSRLLLPFGSIPLLSPPLLRLLLRLSHLSIPTPIPPDLLAGFIDPLHCTTSFRINTTGQFLFVMAYHYLRLACFRELTGIPARRERHCFLGSIDVTQEEVSQVSEPVEVKDRL